MKQRLLYFSVLAAFVCALLLCIPPQSEKAGAVIPPKTTVQHNGSSVGKEPIIDLEDGLSVTWTVTDDTGNKRIQVTPVGGGGGGGSTEHYNSYSTTQTIGASQQGLVDLDSTGGSFTLTLSNVSTTGLWFKLNKLNPGNVITIVDTGGATIGGSSSLLFNAQYSTAYLESNGTNWVIVDLQQHDYCKLYAATNQSVPNNTFTALAMASVDEDTGGLQTSGDNTKITARVPGIYEIDLQQTFDSSTSAINLAIPKLALNGAGKAVFFIYRTTTGPNTYIHFSTVLRLAAGDYVQNFGYQGSGGSINTLSAPPDMDKGVYLSARWIGR